MRSKGAAALLLLAMAAVAAIYLLNGSEKDDLRDPSAVRPPAPTYEFLRDQRPLPLLNLSEKERAYDPQYVASSNYFDPDRDSFYSFQGNYDELVRAARLELGPTVEDFSSQYMAWFWKGEEPAKGLVVIVRDLHITQVTGLERAEFQRMEDLYWEFENWDMGHHDSGWTTVWTRAPKPATPGYRR